MLNIDNDKLKLLLKDRRKKLEKPKYSGIGEFISGISLAITLLLSDMSQIDYINPLYFQIVVWAITLGITMYGIYSLWDSIKNFYSVENLYSEIADLDPNIEHPFNIVLLKNSNEDGKYLLFKSRRWSCWLFPNYRCLEGEFNPLKEKEYIKECLKRDLDINGDMGLRYIGNKISPKFSFSDKIEKKYNFHYFQVEKITMMNNKKHSFQYNGKRYSWKSLHQMYGSKNIVKKNQDVLDYVRSHCDMS